jgi:hypothetical protein
MEAPMRRGKCSKNNERLARESMEAQIQRGKPLNNEDLERFIRELRTQDNFLDLVGNPKLRQGTMRRR